MTATTEKLHHDLWSMEQDVLMRLVFLSTFRPLEESERDGFAGVESENPLIADSSSVIGEEGRTLTKEDTDGFIIVLDGSVVQVMTTTGEHRTFDICPA